MALHQKVPVQGPVRVLYYTEMERFERIQIKLQYLTIWEFLSVMTSKSSLEIIAAYFSNGWKNITYPWIWTSTFPKEAFTTIRRGLPRAFKASRSTKSHLLRVSFAMASVADYFTYPPVDWFSKSGQASIKQTRIPCSPLFKQIQKSLLVSASQKQHWSTTL